MNILNIIKERWLVYLLLLLVVLTVGGAVLLNRYSYFFTNNSDQTANVSYNVTNVEIKQLNTGIFQSSKFQSLQALPTVSTDINSLNKGKRDPFAPN